MALSGNNGRGGDDGRSSGHDSDSRFICINNNDNSGGEATAEEEEDPCTECFAAITDELESAINNVLGGPDPVVIPAEISLPAVSITAQNIDELCAFLDNPISLNQAQINAAIDAFAEGDNAALGTQAIDLVDCLKDAGLIIELPPS